MAAWPLSDSQPKPLYTPERLAAGIADGSAPHLDRVDLA
jgi:hypothetical protein